MSNKFLFLISFVLALSLASAGYGDSPVFKLDFDEADDVNTEAGFTSFLLTDSGSEVNGVIIDLGGNLDSRRRVDPNSNNDPEYPIPIVQEEMYRDFIFGVAPGGIDITLWGLGAGRECKIYIYAYDDASEDRHVANWTANGEYLLTTDFTGGDSTLWPYDPLWYIPTALYYDFNGIAHADEFGSIFLTCTTEDDYAFANALVVIPYGDYNNVEEAHRPQPIDGQEEVPPDVVLSWRPGAYVDEHDVYLGTDFNDVADANTSTAGIYQDTVDTNSYDPPGLLELDRTYYWRVDEVNGLDIWPGEVWSFTTSRSFVVEDFDSYESRDALTDVWEDYFENNSRAFLQLVKTGEPGQRPVRDGNSVEYSFKNDKSPHYSVAEAALADLPSGIGSDWLSMNVKSLALWFYGQEANPVDSRMYVSLTDGDSNTAKVSYGLYDPREDMNDIKVEEWQEWNIAMQEFLDDNPDVNLANVATITIGFGDGSGEDPGIVYFEDIIVHVTRCVLAERSDDFARVDYAPGGVVAGDCVVDSQELEEIARAWLYRDSIVPTKNPNDVNLVLYYQFEEGDGNKVYPHPSGRLNDPCIWSGTFYNSALDPPKDTASWVTPGVPGIGGTGCIYMDGTMGCRLSCGKGRHADLGIGPEPPATKGMTLSIWAKWLGPRYWNSYLLSKGQGFMGKRDGYSENKMIWTFWISADIPSAIGLGHFASDDDATPDLVSPEGTMDPFIGQWAHVAATFPHPSGDVNDANDYARLYLNGTQVSTGPWRLSHGDDPNIILTIGTTSDQNAWPDSPASFYGYLDEARIYDRVLEPNEIAYLADMSPEDGKLQTPVSSGAEVYEEEPVGERILNFKDFAVITDMWLEEQLWP